MEIKILGIILLMIGGGIIGATTKNILLALLGIVLISVGSALWN